MLVNQTSLPHGGADAAARVDAIAAASPELTAVLTLDDRGMIRDCTEVCETLFKYRRSELVWHPVSMLLPELAKLEPMQNGQPNPHLQFLCRIGRRFWVMTGDKERFASELFLNLLDSTGHGRLSLIVRPSAQANDNGRRPSEN